VANGLIDQDTEAIVAELADEIARDAILLNVDKRTIRTQIRLHLPNIHRSMLRSLPPELVYEKIRLQVIARCSVIQESIDRAEKLAYSSLLLGARVLRRDLTVERQSAPTVPLTFGSVQPSFGYFIQSKLHYLMSARCDTMLELGIHAPEAPMPLGYAGFSSCDRQYIREALTEVDPTIDHSQVMVLTRMYGLPSATQNLMSLVIARSAQYLRHSTPVRYIVTAFNPMLGFTGAVYRASGFVPFALAPVTYHYDRRGFYASRRRSGEALSQNLDTPPNVLLVLGVDRHANRLLAKFDKVISIDHQEYLERAAPPIDYGASQKTEISGGLSRHRRILEQAWSACTVHPGYIRDFETNPGPRGQCGVASVWLARELRVRHGIEATYCYGRLETEVAGVSPVDHHCWLEIGSATDPGRLVIDLTCDQAQGLRQTTLCEFHADLSRQGLRYIAFARQRLDELDQDRVWSRYLALRDTVEGVGRGALRGQVATLV